MGTVGEWRIDEGATEGKEVKGGDAPRRQSTPSCTVTYTLVDTSPVFATDLISRRDGSVKVSLFARIRGS